MIDDYKDGEIGKNIGDYSISFYIKIKNKIALAEMTFMEKEIALGYMDLANEENPALFIEMKKLINESESVLFFNRLNVPLEMRNNGYGKVLLNEVINYCKNNNIFLINTANNYGEMGQDNLIKFYEKYGMKLLHSEGLLVFHKNLNYTNKKTKKIK